MESAVGGARYERIGRLSALGLTRGRSRNTGRERGGLKWKNGSAIKYLGRRNMGRIKGG